MAGISEQCGRVHEPPCCAFRACQQDVRTQSNECDTTATVAFTGEEKTAEINRGGSVPWKRNCAHLRFAVSQSARRCGYGRDHANVLQRRHESESESASGNLNENDHGVRFLLPLYLEVSHYSHVPVVALSSLIRGIYVIRNGKGQTYANSAEGSWDGNARSGRA
jgi:hypothetical protein